MTNEFDAVFVCLVTCIEARDIEQEVPTNVRRYFDNTVTSEG